MCVNVPSVYNIHGGDNKIWAHDYKRGYGHSPPSKWSGYITEGEEALLCGGVVAASMLSPSSRREIKCANVLCQQ